jgi:phospholipase D1/2
MAQAFLRPNRNVWRVACASRAAILIDGAAYFRAVRESMMRARRSIIVVGWDIDSRTRLVGETGRADDGLPETLAEFLSELVARRPGLTVHLLLWDFSVLYALEREIFPALALNWNTPDQVKFCLDDCAPLGCSQHQKIVVIDDAIAFTGGLDLTIRRWDTPAHDVSSDNRVDPAGEPYRPFHDVQAVVDGEAARALAEIARERWQQADGSSLGQIDAAWDCWPPSVRPDFSNAGMRWNKGDPGG